MVSSRAVRARVAAGGGDSAVVAVQSPAPRPARGKEEQLQGRAAGDLRARSRSRRATARGRYLHHASPARLGRVDERVVQVKEDRAHPTQPHRFAAQAAREPPRPHRACARPAGESGGGVAGVT